MEHHQRRRKYTNGRDKPWRLPYPAFEGKKIEEGGGRYQTPDSVLAGGPEEVQEVAEEIYSDFNKKHGTDYKFQLKK